MRPEGQPYVAPAVTRQGDLCRAAQPLGGQPRSHAGLCTLTHLQCECWAPSTLQVLESSPAPLRGHPGKESQPRRVPTGSLSPWATVCPTQGTESQNHPGPPGLPGAGGCTLPSCPVPTPLPTSDGGVPLRSHMPVPISRSPTPHVALGSLDLGNLQPQRTLGVPFQISSLGLACTGLLQLPTSPVVSQAAPSAHACRVCVTPEPSRSRTPQMLCLPGRPVTALMHVLLSRYTMDSLELSPPTPHPIHGRVIPAPLWGPV